MRAMVLAAGLGTRLRPLTNDRPKALVKLGGRTMLDITLSRLREFAISDVIINAHHFADALIEYLRVNRNFGMNVEVSREDVLLDTGGGLKQAAHFFSGSNGPFLLHNVDVLSDIDFSRMLRYHVEQDALATLAVQQRASSRLLLFDERSRLSGRKVLGQADEVRRPYGDLKPLAFAGIHVISPRIFDTIKEDGVFSIIDVYLRLAHENERIVAFPAEEYYWRDLGTPEKIVRAEADVRSQAIRLP